MTVNKTKPFEVAIIGGGVSGIILAISLVKRNVPCTIYEKAHAFGEIGAGLGMTPNATRAMKACDPTVFEAFEKVAQPTMAWNFFDGMDEKADDVSQFTLGAPEYGVRGCHRAQFVDALLEVLPDDTTRFNKQLDRVEEPHGPSGKLQMVFRDGTTAEADAVIGCDGIKSHTRGIVVGRDNPSAKPGYTRKYCYRGLVPMDQAKEILGSERAMGSNLWLANKIHMVTYPVAHGTICNVVAHCAPRPGFEEWPSETQLTLPAQHEDFLEDAKGLTPRLMQLVKMTKTVDRWALFDLSDNPVPTLAKGRICLVGDAAHASTPHQGAGAGFCIEDAAVLSSLLADERVQSSDDLAAAFAAFDANRRERGHWLVKGSRRAGELYEFKTEIGKDFQAIGKEVNASSSELWSFDIEKGIKDALDELGQRLAVENKETNYQQGNVRAGL